MNTSITEGSDHTSQFSTRHWPTEIRLKKLENVLEVDFDDGSTFSLPAELLRVESPSAEVQGHSSSEKVVVGGCRYVCIASLSPVGNYAISIVFSDMHDTGIYSWEYLYELGRNKDSIWEEYLSSLEKLGLNREPE